MTKVYIPSALRLLTKGAAEVEVDGHNLGAVLGALEQQFPGIQARLCNRGELRRFFRIAVNNDIVPDKSLFESSVRPTDIVTIVSAIAGG